MIMQTIGILAFVIVAIGLAAAIGQSVQDQRRREKEREESAAWQLKRNAVADTEK